MSKYRTNLPQLSEQIFLTDGGLETTLVFHDGIDLPHFAAFDVMKTPGGRQRVKDYYRDYAATARARGLGFVLECPTWRASAEWGAKLGYDAADLERFNRDAVALMAEIRAEFETAASPMVISGCVGPRGDGYVAGAVYSADEQEAYHGVQIATYAATAADLITGVTINNVPEAIGIVRAARRAGMPVAISFTLETDGRLPSGVGLGEAIEAVDAATGAAPAYYMINCAHPSHFDAVLAPGAAWAARLRGLRANASTLSHAELDNSTALDAGDPVDLGRRYATLRGRLPNITVLGGCCGTDHRHVEAICLACLAA